MHAPDSAGPWDADALGVLWLPSGRLVRGRSTRSRAEPAAEWGLALAAREPAPAAWPVRWVRWPDFRVPADPDDALDALREAHARCAGERVEVTCGGGIGRTGTALAALTMLDGLGAAEAVEWVRRGHHPRAVETRGQRRWLAGHVRALT